MEDYMELKKELWKYAKKIYQRGWVSGSAGNLSLRVPGEDRFIVTPTSIPYEIIEPEQMVVINSKGEMILEQDYGPSIETLMHLAIYKARPEVGAIIHTHSVYCSALAVLKKPLPPVIEELAIYTGGEVEVAEYAPSGSEELAENVVKALGEKSAVILANHGNLCVGRDLLKAFNLCALVERCAQIYLEALSSGEKIHPLPESALQKAILLYKESREK